MGYETQVRNVNFRSIYDEYGPYTGVLYFDSGKYNISYMVPTTGLNSLDFGASENYYTDLPYNNLTNSFAGLTGSQQATVDLILSSGSGYATFFSDVAQVAFNKKTSGTEAAIIMGQLPADAIVFPNSPNDVGSTFFTDESMLDVDSAAIGRLGDVWLNEDFDWSGVATPGTEAFFVILHELAHSVGALKHIDDTGDISLVDNQQYSVLSYNPLGWTNSTTPGSSGNALYNDDETSPLYAYGLQLEDIRNLQNSQKMYGANTATRNEDTDGDPGTTGTLYELGQGLGRGGDEDKAFITTIWDGGGEDTIDVSGFSGYRARIDLNDGHFSSIGSTGKSIGGVYRQGHGLTAGDATSRDINNVAIAYGTMIENAIGGDQDDDITGNELENIIHGGAGADVISGGIGDDTLYGDAGNDIFRWNLGDGDDDIMDWNSGDVIQLGAGISWDMVTIGTSGGGSHITLTVGNGVFQDLSDEGFIGTITILNQGANVSTFLANVTGVTGSKEYTPTTTNNITGSTAATVNGSTANDNMSGNSSVQVLNGGDGDDIINVGSGDTGNGGSGRDKLTSGGGSNTMNGGDGDDWLSSGAVMNGNDGDDIIEGGGSIDGGAGNDNIYVSGNATVKGGADDDVIRVVGDNTTIDGEAGDDVIHLAYMFTALATTIVTGEGDDTIYKSGLWTVDVDWASGATLTDYVFDDETGDLVAEFAGGASTRFIDYFFSPDDWTLPILTGSTGFTYIGNDSDEYVLGLAFHDVIEGNGGNDEIHAGIGNDEIYGGAGNDILYGDDDDDLIDGGDGDDDIYAESGNDTVKGGAGTDELFLGSGVGIGDVTLHKDGDNLVIKVNDGRTITLVDQYVNISSSYVHAVETFDSTNLLTAMLGLNNLPQAQVDAFSGNEDTNITGNLLSDNGSGADSDPDSDPLTVTAGTFATAHGSVTISSNGNFTYTPTANYNGTDSFEYEANDGEGGTDTAVVTLTVNAVNDAFSISNGGASFDQDTTFTFTTAQLSATDVDNTDDQLVFELTSAPAHGTLKLGATALGVNDSFTKQDIIDGLVKFYPTTGYTGSDSFDFTASDGTYTWPSSLTFNLTINPISLNLNGTSGNDTLTGGAGDDTISGFGGDDTLYGMAGDDLITGGSGSDWIEGGDDNDVIYTNGGAIDYAFGGAGDDIIYNYGPTTSQADLVSFYSLTSAQLNDYDGLFGGDGNDKLYAQFNRANLYGENGNDELYGSSANNSYIASDGYDIVDDEGHMNYGAGVGGTDDLIFLTTASGYLYGNLKYTTANNHQDLYIWLSATAGVTIKEQFTDANNKIEYIYQQSTGVYYTLSSTLSSFDIIGTSGNDTLNGFDSLTFGDDTIRGNAGADTINGKGGIDWIYGGAGNDTLTGGAGNDLLYGEADSDTYVFNLGDGQDTVTDTGGTADKILLGSGIALSNIVLTDVGTYDLEMTFTNAPSDKITMANFRNGSSNKIETISFNGADYNFIYGTSSSETLTGTSGADLVYGRGGTNAINTGNGNDIIVGGDNQDDVNYVIDTYSGNKTVYGNGGNDRILTGSGTDTIYGGDGDDSINGLGGDDTIYAGNGDDVGVSGGAGNDTIYGEDGADYLIGWIGNDILYGGNGNDELWGGHPSGYSALASAFGAHTATNNTKTLDGGTGDDLLYGYIGLDTLLGGTGADTLTGGDAADEFVFKAADVGTGVDTITDFSKTSGDTINIADLIEGFYDPMQHSIDDFVTATTSGGNTTLAVDRDGLGSTYSSQNVVVINGQTWTNLADMISSGDLIVQD